MNEEKAKTEDSKTEEAKTAESKTEEPETEPSEARSESEQEASQPGFGEGQATSEEGSESDQADTDWEAMARSRYDQLLRLQADFDNFRRRVDRERNEMQGLIAERLLRDLLPVFDNLERALQYMPRDGDAKAWRVGVEMTLNGFLEAFARMGVRSIEAKGQPFDPRFHEAVEQVDSEEPEGIIVEELQRGFVWNDRVLRASLVKVSTGS